MAHFSGDRYGDRYVGNELGIVGTQEMCEGSGVVRHYYCLWKES